MGGKANIAYSANSLIKVAPATEDHVGSQSWPSACNTPRQSFTGIDYNTQRDCMILSTQFYLGMHSS